MRYEKIFLFLQNIVVLETLDSLGYVYFWIGWKQILSIRLMEQYPLFVKQRSLISMMGHSISLKLVLYVQNKNNCHKIPHQKSQAPNS